MLSAFQSIMSAQLSVSQIMSHSENFVKDAHHSADMKVFQELVMEIVTESVWCRWSESVDGSVHKGY